MFDQLNNTSSSISHRSRYPHTESDHDLGAQEKLASAYIFDPSGAGDAPRTSTPNERLTSTGPPVDGRSLQVGSWSSQLADYVENGGRAPGSPPIEERLQSVNFDLEVPTTIGDEGFQSKFTFEDVDFGDIDFGDLELSQTEDSGDSPTPGRSPNQGSEVEGVAGADVESDNRATYTQPPSLRADSPASTIDSPPPNDNRQPDPNAHIRFREGTAIGSNSYEGTMDEGRRRTVGQGGFTGTTFSTSLAGSRATGLTGIGVGGSLKQPQQPPSATASATSTINQRYGAQLTGSDALTTTVRRGLTDAFNADLEGNGTGELGYRTGVVITGEEGGTCVDRTASGGGSGYGLEDRADASVDGVCRSGGVGGGICGVGVGGVGRGLSSHFSTSVDQVAELASPAASLLPLPRCQPHLIGPQTNRARMLLENRTGSVSPASEGYESDSEDADQTVNSQYDESSLSTSMEDLQTENIDICHHCHLGIKDRYLLTVNGRTWHSECLSCCECGQLLDSAQTCFIRQNSIYCKLDFAKKFGTKCSKCLRNIHATDWVRRARDHVFHLACFSCDNCKRQLSTGEEFALKDGRVICKTHYIEIVEGGCGTDDESQSSKSKAKRVRTTFSEEQLQVLQANFTLDSNPDGQDLERIAQITGLSKRVTQVWFQNSRARQKKHQYIGPNGTLITTNQPIPNEHLMHGGVTSAMGVSGSAGSAAGGGVGGLPLPNNGCYGNGLTGNVHSDLTNSLDSHSPDNSDLYRAPGSDYDYEMSP